MSALDSLPCHARTLPQPQAPSALPHHTGAAVAAALAREGAAVCLTARSAGALDATADVCRAAGAAHVSTHPCDMADPQQVLGGVYWSPCSCEPEPRGAAAACSSSLPPSAACPQAAAAACCRLPLLLDHPLSRPATCRWSAWLARCWSSAGGVALRCWCWRQARTPSLGRWMCCRGSPTDGMPHSSELVGGWVGGRTGGDCELGWMGAHAAGGAPGLAWMPGPRFPPSLRPQAQRVRAHAPDAPAGARDGGGGYVSLCAERIIHCLALSISGSSWLLPPALSAPPAASPPIARSPHRRPRLHRAAGVGGGAQGGGR